MSSYYTYFSEYYKINPVPKPRMTQSDKWKTGARARPCVRRYRAFADKARELGIVVPEHGAHIVFHLPMPKSWPKAKRDAMRGRGHRQKPDKDNLEKALLDAIYQADDSFIWDLRVTKLWADEGAIEILIDNSEPKEAA